VFRVAGKQPELWDAVTGSIRHLSDYRVEEGRTLVPLQFAPRESSFVIFRVKARQAAQSEQKNFRLLRPALEVAGAWSVQFDPKWFYPDNGTGGKLHFEQLTDWTKRPEEAVRHFAGIATYRTTFESKLKDTKTRVFLDLGVVKNVARVRLNGHDLGSVWTAPWHVEIGSALVSGANQLEIAVANLWPNRLIGDATLPIEKRRTVTNVRTYDTMESGTYGCRKCAERKKSGKPAELLSSGLLGPVRVMVEE
jgi:hypothetical protein